jgi:hypothetical protein
VAQSLYYSNTAVANTIGNTGGISSSATSCYCTTTPSGYPGSFPFKLVLDAGTSGMEIVLVTAGAGTAASPWTITRGYDSTTAQAHGGGSSTGTVTHDFTAGDATLSRQHEASGSGSGVHGLPLTAWQTGSFSVISELQLSNSTTTVQTFSGIPQTYNHLLLIVVARLTETTQLSDDISLQINGDSGAHYSYLTISATNTSGTLTAPGDFTTFSATSVPLFRVAASQGGSAVNIGAGFALIPWYAGSAFNSAVLSMSGMGNGTSAVVDGRVRWGFWNPATQAAVSSLSLAAPAGSDFLTGSSFGLYGLT